MLITAWEVVKYSPASPDYPTTYICQILENKEQELFRKCIGNDIYDLLKADVKSITYTEYVSGGTYALNAVVLFDGVLYESTVANNTAYPSDKSKWTKEVKFNKSCYNVAWENYIRPFLAYQIFFTSLPYSTNQASAKGLTTFKEADQTGVSTSDYKTFLEYRNQVLYDANEILENFREWRKVEANKECFPLSSSSCGCDDENGLGCVKKVGRRIAFKR